MITGGLLLLVLAMITSAIAAAFGRRRGIPRLGAAAVVAVETIGAAVLFFAVNVMVGIALVLAARRLTPFYLSIYQVSDLVLLIISLLQALVFEAWRHSERGLGPRDAQGEQLSPVVKRSGSASGQSGAG